MNLYQYAVNPVGWVDPLGWAPCGKNKKTSFEASSRRHAFREAKRDADVPMIQRPMKIERPRLLDANKKVIMGPKGEVLTREYYFTNKDGKPVVIQEHSLGHDLATKGHVAEAHFNVRPIDNLNTGSVEGTYGHYNF